MNETRGPIVECDRFRKAKVRPSQQRVQRIKSSRLALSGTDRLLPSLSQTASPRNRIDAMCRIPELGLQFQDVFPCYFTDT